VADGPAQKPIEARRPRSQARGRAGALGDRAYLPQARGASERFFFFPSIGSLFVLPRLDLVSMLDMEETKADEIDWESIAMQQRQCKLLINLLPKIRSENNC
jgi:hypothetical protein